MDKIDFLLSSMDGFFTCLVDESSDMLEVTDLFEDIEEISTDVQSKIDEHLFTTAKDNFNEQVIILKVIVSRLKGYYLSTPIDEQALYNILVFNRVPWKYKYTNFIDEMKGLVKVFRPYMPQEAIEHHLITLKGIEQENPAARIYHTLPCIGYKEADLLNKLKELEQKGYAEAYTDYLDNENWLQCAPRAIRPYIAFTLQYEKEQLKNTILLEVFGFVLNRLEKAQNNAWTFKDLFKDRTDYNRVYQILRQMVVIDLDNKYFGVETPGVPRSNTTSSLIALVEVLNEKGLLKRADGYGYFKKDFSKKEQVRIIAQTFGLPRGNSILTKKSQFHIKIKAAFEHVLGSFR